MHCQCCRVKIKVRNFKTVWCSAIFNKQECIAIMLLCLNHDHSSQSMNRRLTCMVSATEVWQPLWQHHTESLLAQITHSRPTIATNAHALYCVTIHDLSPPLAGFLLGDHLWQRPSMATKVGPGGPSTATQFPVEWSNGPGDHLWHDRPDSS